MPLACGESHAGLERRRRGVSPAHAPSAATRAGTSCTRACCRPRTRTRRRSAPFPPWSAAQTRPTLSKKWASSKPKAQATLAEPSLARAEPSRASRWPGAFAQGPTLTTRIRARPPFHPYTSSALNLRCGSAGGATIGGTLSSPSLSCSGCVSSAARHTLTWPVSPTRRSSLSHQRRALR